MLEVNYLAILISALISMVLGSLWYSPVLFGNKWMKLMGMTKESMENNPSMKKEMGIAYSVTFIGSLIMAYVLAHLIQQYAHADTAWTGAQTGFWIWLGFFATSALNGVFFEKRKWDLYFINVGYYLVLLILMGMLLAVWQQ